MSLLIVELRCGTRTCSGEPREQMNVLHGKRRPRVMWVGVQGCGRGRPPQGWRDNPDRSFGGKTGISREEQRLQGIVITFCFRASNTLSSPSPYLMVHPHHLLTLGEAVCSGPGGCTHSPASSSDHSVEIGSPPWTSHTTAQTWECDKPHPESISDFEIFL